MAIKPFFDIANTIGIARIQYRPRCNLDTISVQWGEEDELVLPIVARIPDDVVQRDPIEECYGENCSLEFHHRKILSSKLVSII